MKGIPKITVKQLYSSIIKQKRVTNADGWTRMEPVEQNDNPTTSPVMNAVARAMREKMCFDAYELGRYLQVGVTELDGVVRLYMGMSLGRFIREYRDMRAIEYLTCSSLSIGEIAKACGYAFSTTFTNDFKRRHQMSPLHYRNRFRPASYKELYRV